jgi:hypothetical protein
VQLPKIVIDRGSRPWSCANIAQLREECKPAEARAAPTAVVAKVSRIH